MITSIRTIVSNLALDPGAFDLFLFGSAVRESTPGDIDLLLVYDSHFVTLRRAVSVKIHLATILEGATGLPVDIVLLSRDEEAQSGFSVLEQAQRI